VSELDNPSAPTRFTPEAARHIFSNANETPEDRRAALSTLIGAKVLPKEAGDDAIARGRVQLIADAINHPEPKYRLLAIAETIRLGQVVKRWLPEITKQLEVAFEHPLAPMQLLDDADDRLNVARACSLFQRDWMPQYLAISIAEEEQGEKARCEMIAALLIRVPTLADGLRMLAPHFENLRPKTETPSDTVARRLTRTLNALRGAILESELDAGDELGKALHRTISGALSLVGRPQDEKAQIDLARETLLTVHDIVRTRISVVADPDMYLSISYCRQICGGVSWPDGLKKPINRLITDVTEALLLLGRQGQCDQALLGQLNVLCNYPERARIIAKEIADRHPELPEDVRDWLERGRVRNVRAGSSSSRESAASNADGTIGLAMQIARAARRSSSAVRDRLISNLQIYEPSMVPAISDILDKVQALAVHLDQVASLRDLELYGTPGDEVDASAKFFDVVGSNPRQRMVVKQSAIVKKRADGSIGDVVLKGLVE
jgi:hypothetical protein